MSKIYCSTIKGGFYCDSIDAHGPRAVLVADPDWISPEDDPEATAPLIEMANPLCELPPADELTEITWAQHKALLAAQAAGKVIQIGKDNQPIAVDPPEPTREQLIAAEDAWIAAQVLSTEPLVSRHRDERDMDEPTTLSASQFSELLAYRKALRWWPEQTNFPQAKDRPQEPAWLAEAI